MSQDLDANPFITEDSEQQTPFQSEPIDEDVAVPASIPLPSSFSAEAYPQDDPPAAYTASTAQVEPSPAAADARNRSASVASSERPPKDAIQVSDERAPRWECRGVGEGVRVHGGP